MTSCQIERLRALVNDEWVDEENDAASEAEFKRLISEVESSQELHVFASNFNWDCGWEELEAVINCPRCDRGTALMLYWLSQPEFFYKELEKDNELMDYEQESWDRTKWLENKLVGDAFPLQSIRFDPEEHIGRPLSSDDKSGIRHVPKSLWPASLGETVEFDADLLWR